MGLLVEDLLLLARLDRERPLALAPVELPVLATDAVQAARAVAPDRADRAGDRAAAPGPLVVLGDDARLRQVIGNLMTNALTHTPPDAAVTLRLRAEAGNLAVVEVADTGPGLSPEQARAGLRAVLPGRRGADPPGRRRPPAPVSAWPSWRRWSRAHHGTVEVAATPGGGRDLPGPAAARADEDPDELTAAGDG